MSEYAMAHVGVAIKCVDCRVDLHVIDSKLEIMINYN